MGAALCLFLPLLIASNQEERSRYDAAYYGCKQKIILKDKNSHKYVVYCSRDVIYGSHYCRYHQY